MSCQPRTSEVVEIRGIYGNPKSLWDKGYNLRDLGVNAIFVHSGSISPAMIQQARSEGAKVFAEFATLNGKGYVEQHPEAWAIDEKGERVQAATWFMGVCPTEPGFRQYRIDQLRSLISTYELDGVWMDYVHWHAQFEDPEPILPETCFCDHCLQVFSDYSKIEVPEGSTSAKATWLLTNHEDEWRDWRGRVIYEWAFEMKRIVKENNPDALLGLYHCPWNDDEFNGARYRILGLDYDLLKEAVDVFSPMVYHARMGRDPNWVEENINWFSDRIGDDDAPKIWPIVQAHNDPHEISAEEFEMVMKGGLAGKSSGIMMFTTNSMAEDEEKTAVMKNIYLPLRDRN